MQTRFSEAQLADPGVREADGILRACVHCGFCLATCPTYLLLGDELDGPRGRIYLIKEMLESGKPATAATALHIDRCLSCLSCMTTCPSGVHYQHLVDDARVRIESTLARPWSERLLRGLIAHVLPYRARFRVALIAGFLARPFQRFLPRRLAAMVGLARRVAPPSAVDRPQVFAAQGQRRMRVGLLTGCVQPSLRPEINDATVRLLTRLGAEVVVVGAGCCGALVHHMGREAEALRQAKDVIAAFDREPGLDAIVANASGCGTMLKDYGFVFRTDPVWATRAARIAGLAKDVSEVVATLGLGGRAGGVPSRRVAYHSACSLQNGQGIAEAPKRLLAEAGFEVVEPVEPHICCGSAGAYNILQPQLADGLRQRKVANLAALQPDIIAAGNIGCLVQIGAGMRLPVVHTVELLDWATGGPPPPELART
ncbi:MAG: glycolate oxidase subunit GlcF [Rhodospirillales bacterium]|nr:glycolate oxidase subunit GlcF [Rhodospirillales bacterium]